MTKRPNESIPFADTEDEEALERFRGAVEFHLNSCYRDGEIDEDNYRRLSIAVCEVHGDPYDYFGGIMREIVELHEANLLDRIITADEFINSIEKEDPRYVRAVAKYERLHKKFRESKGMSA